MRPAPICFQLGLIQNEEERDHQDEERSRGVEQPAQVVALILHLRFFAQGNTS